MGDLIDRLFNKHKLVRRAGIFWAWWIISVVLLRATEPQTLVAISAAGASVVASTVGILATVIALYNRDRDREEKGYDPANYRSADGQGADSQGGSVSESPERSRGADALGSDGGHGPI